MVKKSKGMGGKRNAREKKEPHTTPSLTIFLTESSVIVDETEEFTLEFRAQDLVYVAMESTDQNRRIALAREALEIWPNCADAHVLLAEETAAGPEEAISIYMLGVAAGERALGVDYFQTEVGNFWCILETRPYMRARHGLALSLWEAGLHDDAIFHLDDMLRLNPDDNQGNRYLLAAWLLELGREEQLAGLLKSYKKDGTAAWAYSEALCAFKKKGNAATSRRLLAKALKANQHVPEYLLGKSKIPMQLPAFYGFGDKNEAINYARGFSSGWEKTDGALVWLAQG